VIQFVLVAVALFRVSNQKNIDLKPKLTTKMAYSPMRAIQSESLMAESHQTFHPTSSKDLEPNPCLRRHISQRTVSNAHTIAALTEEVDRPNSTQHKNSNRSRIPFHRLDMKSTIRKVSGTRNELLPYSRSSTLGAIKEERGEEVADDEDANTTYEERHCWQRKHQICDIPRDMVSS